MNVNGFADDLSVPSFGRRMVCTVCGAIGRMRGQIGTSEH
jgi:hypothetical protein